MTETHEFEASTTFKAMMDNSLEVVLSILRRQTWFGVVSKATCLQSTLFLMQIPYRDSDQL